MAALDGEFYWKKDRRVWGIYCLLTFLEDQYPNKVYIFWPDLVRAQRARATLQCLKGAGIPFF